MTKKEKQAREKGLLPFDVIAAAVDGSPEAIMAVMDHYKKFMIMQANVWVRDADGKFIKCYSQDIYDELFIKLIQAILSFKL